MQNPRPHGREFLAFLEDNLDLDRWGFRLSHTDFPKDRVSVAIYNSEMCRIRFDHTEAGYFSGDDVLHANYGRLHAPDRGGLMTWNGESCYCWHESGFFPVHFLEGHTAEEVASQKGMELLPPTLQAYHRSEDTKRLRSADPLLYVLNWESLLWDRFGARLFELFDLRRPDTWESFRQFVEEYYRLRPSSLTAGSKLPPEYQIC